MTKKNSKTATPKKKKGASTIKVKRVEDMTPKQQAFVREYPKDFNFTAAAKRAGYADRSARQQGQRLMTIDVIQKEVAKQVERNNRVIEKKTDVSAEWIVEKLKLTVERCLQITPVMVKDGDQWVESGEFKFEHSGSNKALEMLGRYLGIWKDRVDLKATLDINHIDDIPTDMLIAVIQQLGDSGQKQITLDAEGRVVT